MDACEATRRLVDDIASWKASLQNYGSSYDAIRINIDAVEVLLRSVIHNATTISDVGSMLADDMVDVLSVISDDKNPSDKTRERVGRRLLNLKRTCENMIRDCQNCKENFSHIHDRLKNIERDLDERESEIDKEIRELRATKRKSWITCIISCVAAVAIAAVTVICGIPVVASGVVLGTGARFGVAALFSCLQLCTTWSECDRYATQIENLCLERNTVRDISDGVSKGASGVERITEWWHTVRDELVRLQVQFTNVNEWEAR
ncbi:hypothetical protein SCHPADRAFT_887688 [Schizopora paradoxa]|uniref:Uncharacterized protein n=1 Tax=Schizopora paradoxa TaxID=27342 RepID=A0A0H2RY15_9AGAM|nr:hypothetical protein SCHPADRAFT_887688 [Schizopora paradoxa]